jgi:hypothetical protein
MPSPKFHRHITVPSRLSGAYTPGCARRKAAFLSEVNQKLDCGRPWQGLSETLEAMRANPARSPEFHRPERA